MKLNGTHKFTVPSTQVFNAILDAGVLKASIPGADDVSYSSPTQLQVQIVLPFPGLHGPFNVFINIVNQQAPNFVELNVPHKGKGGSVDATCQISLADEADGSLLTYNANAELEGLIAVANNPIGQGIVKSKLGEFFKNLDKAVTQMPSNA
jgi:carbon monoxide dehydrogenase subunit G